MVTALQRSTTTWIISTTLAMQSASSGATKRAGELGVPFGLNIVDVCDETMDCVIAVEGANLVRRTGTVGKHQWLQEQTVSTLAGFLIGQGS